MHINKMQQLRRSLAVAFLLLSAMGVWANITVSFSKIPLRQAFREIEKVSDLHFFYKSTLEELDATVSLNVKDDTTGQALDKLFAGVPLKYKLESNGVVVVYHEKDAPGSDKASDKKKSSGFSIKGIVTDDEGEPVIGATVRIRGTRNAVATDYNGQYILSDVHKGDIVEVSYIGYDPKTLSVGAAGTYDIHITSSVSSLNEVVVVGYGSQKRVNLTGAVSVIKSEDLAGRPTQNAASAIQGADPSVNLTFGSGGPNSGYSVDIRGVASINGGSPLILVDGVQMDLTRVNANDIESVSVLKDASAAAIYGAKASSGVVLVTTKSGSEDSNPRVSFDLKAGWKTATADNDYITSGFWSVFINDWFMYEHNGYGFTTYDDYDYAELWMRLGQTSESAERPWSVVQPDKSYKYYANFDWYNHYFKKNRPMQDYNVSVTGGSKR
ncbi:MAG: TonB-dependent receptor plug domain-containing protein, partial [Muribaculaceae bacterium]|nr:TonB-dependent receptor plug domain-containing protein [Muribaculaceae bacterium]